MGLSLFLFNWRFFYVSMSGLFVFGYLFVGVSDFLGRGVA